MTSVLTALEWSSPRNHRQGLSPSESQFARMPGKCHLLLQSAGLVGFSTLSQCKRSSVVVKTKGSAQWPACSRAQPCLLHPWGYGAFPTPLEKTLCPPESLLLPALCTELIALINPANPALGDGAGVGEEAFGVSCFTEGQIPQQTVGKGTARASLGQPEPNADIRPCQWITHSSQLILVLHKGGDWSFHSTKWDAARRRLKTNKGKWRMGEWE